MKVFATKVWGYEPERWAVLGFSREGSRNRLAGQIAPEDWVLHIGTRSAKETRTEDRGIALGIARVSEAAIATADAVEPALWAEYLAENGGRPKWPYGLPMVEARRFVSPPEERDEYLLIPRFRDANLALVLATDAVELEPEEAATILALPWASCTLFDSAPLREAQDRAAMRQSLRARRSPIQPTFGERTSAYVAQPACTYVFELVGKGLNSAVGDQMVGGKRGKRVYKVGYAIDAAKRVASLNFGLPNLRVLSWKVRFRHEHDDPIAAVAMEAEMHELLDKFTAPDAGNTEVFFCDESALLDAWQRAIGSAARRAQQLGDSDA